MKILGFHIWVSFYYFQSSMWFQCLANEEILFVWTLFNVPALLERGCVFINGALFCNSAGIDIDFKSKVDHVASVYCHTQHLHTHLGQFWLQASSSPRWSQASTPGPSHQYWGDRFLSWRWSWGAWTGTRWGKLFQFWMHLCHKEGCPERQKGT